MIVHCMKDTEGNLLYETNPHTITIYLPSGEVHVLRGVSEVKVLVNGLLRFTDREGGVSFTSNPFTLTFKNKEATDA